MIKKLSLLLLLCGSLNASTVTRYFYCQPIFQTMDPVSKSLKFQSPFKLADFPGCKQKLKFGMHSTFMFVQITLDSKLSSKLTTFAMNLEKPACAEVAKEDFDACKIMIIEP